jgi:hypothetical protein
MQWPTDLPMQYVPITTKVVSLNPTHGEVYAKQHYVIKFVGDLRQVCGFLRTRLTVFYFLCNDLK